jgi:phosphoserine phosphatase
MALGVPHLLAVRLQRDPQGRATGRIDGVPSFREGKIARVHQWLADQGHTLVRLRRSIFYSDSTNDLPLLELASEPVATNPARRSKPSPCERGWRILRLFP